MSTPAERDATARSLCGLPLPVGKPFFPHKLCYGLNKGANAKCVLIWRGACWKHARVCYYIQPRAGSPPPPQLNVTHACLLSGRNAMRSPLIGAYESPDHEEEEQEMGHSIHLMNEWMKSDEWNNIYKKLYALNALKLEFILNRAM